MAKLRAVLCKRHFKFKRFQICDVKYVEKNDIAEKWVVVGRNDQTRREDIKQISQGESGLVRAWK